MVGHEHEYSFFVYLRLTFGHRFQGAWDQIVGTSSDVEIVGSLVNMSCTTTKLACDSCALFLPSIERIFKPISIHKDNRIVA
jgi:hypothetical protein